MSIFRVFPTNIPFVSNNGPFLRAKIRNLFNILTHSPFTTTPAPLLLGGGDYARERPSLSDFIRLIRIIRRCCLKIIRKIREIRVRKTSAKSGSLTRYHPYPSHSRARLAYP